MRWPERQKEENKKPPLTPPWEVRKGKNEIKKYKF